MNPLKRCSHPNPVKVISYGKRDFANIVKVQLLRWGGYPDVSRWTQCNHKFPYKREAGDQNE